MAEMVTTSKAEDLRLQPRAHRLRSRHTAHETMRAILVTGALILVAGCAFPDVQVRKLAATDFGCPDDLIVLHELPSGYLARGCRKEAQYIVWGGQAARNTDVTRATVDERPQVPIDRVANTNSIGVN